MSMGEHFSQSATAWRASLSAASARAPRRCGLEGLAGKTMDGIEPGIASRGTERRGRVVVEVNHVQRIQ